MTRPSRRCRRQAGRSRGRQVVRSGVLERWRRRSGRLGEHARPSAILFSGDNVTRGLPLRGHRHSAHQVMRHECSAQSRPARSLNTDHRSSSFARQDDELAEERRTSSIRSSRYIGLKTDITFFDRRWLRFRRSWRRSRACGGDIEVELLRFGAARDPARAATSSPRSPWRGPPSVS